MQNLFLVSQMFFKRFQRKFNSNQKGFSVNKNLHYLNITKVFFKNINQISKYCLMVLSQSLQFSIARFCTSSQERFISFKFSFTFILHSSISFSPFSFISLFAYFPMILLSNGSLLRIFVFALKSPPIMIKTFLLMLLMMSDNCS